MKSKKAVCIISGGMDSALSAFIAKNEGYEIIALHFDYRQRTEKKERESFYKLCKRLNASELVIDLGFFGTIGGSALTDKKIAVPTSGVDKNIVPVTYVPFRNGIFLSVAASVAEKEHAKAIFIGVVEEDSSGYPDCTNSYIKTMQEAINLGTKDDFNLKIKTPLIKLSKADIVKKSLELKVPLEYTWSCYQSEDLACGVCDSCRLRLNGFKQAGVKDSIKYV